MPLKDYEHWNEEAQIIWWNEEGKHDPPPMVDVEDDEYCERYYDYEDEEEDIPFTEATDEEIERSFDAYR
jgi:hypothetical protein